MKNSPIAKVTGLFVGLLATAGLTFISQVVFSKALTPHEYGKLISLISLVTISSTFITFGVDGFLLRMYAKEGLEAKRWSFSVVNFLSLSIPILLGAYVYLGSNEFDTRTILLLIPFLLVLSTTQLCRAIWQLEQRYNLVSFSNLSPALIRFIVSLIAVTMGLHFVETVNYLFIFSIIALIILGGYLLNTFRGEIQLAGHEEKASIDTKSSLIPATTANVIRLTWPYSLLNCLGIIFLQQTIYLLSILGTPVQAAVFGVAFAFVSATFMLPTAIYANYLLPKIHRWAEHDEVRLLKTFQIMSGSMLLTGIAIGLIVFFSSPLLVLKIFGEQYKDSVMVLNWLSIMIPLRFLATALGTPLISGKYVTKRLISISIALTVTIIGNLVLIPHYGALGVAWSLIIGQSVLGILYLYFSIRCVFGFKALKGWFTLSNYIDR